MCTDHVNITPRLSTTVYITSILLFPICLHFLAIFPWVTIFGNVHRPCQWHPNIVNNFHIISILIFPDFMAILVLITIFGNAHRPCWQYPNIVNNSLHHVYSFFLHISWFSDYIYINYYIWKCAQTMSTVSYIVNNSLFFFSWFFRIFWLYLH